MRYPSFSPDGKIIAYLFYKYEKEPKNWIDDSYLYLTKTDGSSDRQVSGLSYFIGKPSWFPDSRRLAIASKDYKVYIVNTETGEERKIIDFGIAPTISHDGKRIAYLSKDVDDSIKKKMIEYQLMSRKEYEETWMKKEDKREEMEFSKLFLTNAIYLYDVDTGQSKKISDEGWIAQPAVWSPDDKYLVYNDRRAVVNDIFVLDVKTGEKEQLKGKHGRVMVWRR